MSRWYGNVLNRMRENQQFVDEIKVGDGATEYLWSDSHAYEVTKVINQKRVFIRRYDRKIKGEAYMGNNNWELISNPKNKETKVVFRYNHWYKVIRKNCLGEELEKPRYEKIDISFGIADEYYDYEF